MRSSDPFNRDGRSSHTGRTDLRGSAPPARLARQNSDHFGAHAPNPLTTPASFIETRSTRLRPDARDARFAAEQASAPRPTRRSRIVPSGRLLGTGMRDFSHSDATRRASSISALPAPRATVRSHSRSSVKDSGRTTSDPPALELAHSRTEDRPAVLLVGSPTRRFPYRGVRPSPDHALTTPPRVLRGGEMSD